MLTDTFAAKVVDEPEAVVFLKTSTTLVVPLPLVDKMSSLPSPSTSAKAMPVTPYEATKVFDAVDDPVMYPPFAIVEYTYILLALDGKLTPTMRSGLPSPSTSPTATPTTPGLLALL